MSEELFGAEWTKVTGPSDAAVEEAVDALMHAGAGCGDGDFCDGWEAACCVRARTRAARAVLSAALPITDAQALNDAADAIQALHPGEVKASVEFLRERAARIVRGSQ